jgi:DNA recombination protein RmuC
MSDFLFIFIVFVIVLTGILVALFYIKRETLRLLESGKEEPQIGMIKQDIENLRKKFENGYSQMAYELGRVQEIGRGMKEFQDFLRSPKLRGNIGEEILKDLLEQSLPQSNFSLQYQFKEGRIVDAIIKTNQGIIPIDSKFPMENFRRTHDDKEENKKQAKRDFTRDIRKHISDISSKYILPSEGTVDFALMYIPSEQIYYEINAQYPDILDYANEKRIYLVSPNTFNYFLKTVLLSLQGARIEEGAKKIIRGMKSVQQETINFERDFSVLTSHIDHAKTSSERTKVRLDKLINKIERLEELEEPESKEKLEGGTNNPSQENQEL